MKKQKVIVKQITDVTKTRTTKINEDNIKIEYYNYGRLSEIYYKSYLDEPNDFEYEFCDNLSESIYDIIHRDNNLPAYIKFDNNGNMILEEYYLYGNLHNLNGAAIVKYTNFKKENERFFINDIEYTKNEYHKQIRKLKLEQLKV